MLEQIQHDIKVWTPFKERPKVKRYLEKLRRERRKWKRMTVVDYAE